MPRSRPNIVRHTLKDGTVREYRYERPVKRRAPEQGSLGWAIRQYFNSPEFKNLRPGSQAIYRRSLLLLEPIREYQLSQITRKHLLRVRDAIADRPGAANSFSAAVGAFFAWCLDRGHRADFSPAQRLKRLPLHKRGPWPDHAIAKAEAEMEGVSRLAFLLGLHTGQRIGDILTMTWAQYQDGLIHVIQQKTGVELWIPATPDLADALADEKRTARGLTIIARPDGQPYTTDGFAGTWNRELKRLGLSGLLFHELRHTAATRLAERGCTAFEIGAVTGHKSLAVLQGYVQAAEQKKLARSAMAKVVALPNVKRRSASD